ncbi:hypothetical protein M409DRAFT_64757 [Zasmidium cellare ATCC 36951]|uniref:Uncharacterized protein n=1 Tax=Zasmidium cellare ATCC 36951 TaxID=1080233 RepID=A0A6A6CV86_ZASCE|nr:uncharacterized protein M409DRAFT_64757 [Zasmidium cellare ATCC 36951]KAF2169722.1 hypothetical protein M409DRAFT_64757 [Zasmidium cellare ATCC 36951]
MLPTPSTSHIDPSRIYEPAEDSYLLLDTLSSSSETAFMQQRFPPKTPCPLVLEVGTGSGVVVAFVNAHAKHIFGRTDVATLGTDVNSFACKGAAQTVNLAATESGNAGVLLDVVLGDLASSLNPGSVDVLIFNPPYVPTEELPSQPVSVADEQDLDRNAQFERDSHLLSLSYAGGVDGMETTNRLLGQIPQVLSLRGVAYVLLCKQNKPREVVEQIQAWPGSWNAEIVGSSGKQAGWEKLCVVRIWRVS